MFLTNNFLANWLERSFWERFFFPCLLFGLTILLLPIAQAFQFDPDEGLEVVKASLYLQGFELYGQIWNDQPPLLTYLLAVWFGLFGKSVFTGRLLIAVLATLLLWSFAQILGMYVTKKLALLGTFLLFLAQNFATLSVSIMFGLPSVSFMMLSIYTILVSQQQANLFLLIISAIFFGLSLQTKLFTAPLILAIVIHILFSSDRITSKIGKVLLWLIICIGTFLVIAWSLNAWRWDQLLEANLAGNVRSAFQERSSLSIVLNMLQRSLMWILLAIWGLWCLKQEGKLTRDRGYVFPLVWLGIILPVLLKHQPLWYHYSILLSIPLCWLATYGLIPLINIIRGQNKRFAKIVTIIVCMAIVARTLDIYFTGRKYLSNTDAKLAIVRDISQHRRSNSWIFTDVPMYAFRANLNVPPEMAVFSRKRWRSGNLSQQRLCKIIQDYRPEQILLGRFIELDRELKTCIDPNIYQRKIYKIGKKEQLIHYLASE